jgi:potassium-transporting ATPase potassium-binding subunit
MSTYGWLQIALYMVILLLLVKPLGRYMARVYSGGKTMWDPLLGPLERLFYRWFGISPEDEMTWTRYAIAFIMLSVVGLLATYGFERLQHLLPWNPESLPAVPPDLAFNTASSFATNTNWQNYGGESTMSYLTQMAALARENFLSAAAGMAVLAAFIRGLARASAKTLGNFWVDVTRTVLYILLPLSVVFALVLAQQGVVATLRGYAHVPLLQPTTYDEPVTDANGKPVLDAKGQPTTKTVKVTEQVIAVGPAASQISIKQLGTNGGGFFNVNSAHPFENPTPLTNFLELLAILAIPAALCYTFGMMVGDTRQGWAVLAAMTLVFVGALAVCVIQEQNGNPALTAAGANQIGSAAQPGGNMEGKELRFGISTSALWATATTSASNGSVNSMHDSFTPLGGLIPMWMIQLGEVIYGGVGSGLYGMLAFVIVAVFVAGLMVGRTPEYLGKKIEGYEMKMASLMILIPVAFSLAATALAVATPAGRAGASNAGPHGFSEILYAFSSQSNNNGSAFAGVNSNTPFYNLVGAVCMLVGRYWLAIPALAIAGSLVTKKRIPAGAGTLSTHTPLFVFWLIGVVLIVGALSFIPALALGPIVEHLLMRQGAQF